MDFGLLGSGLLNVQEHNIIVLYQLIHISDTDGYKFFVELGLGSTNKHFLFSF